MPLSWKRYVVSKLLNLTQQRLFLLQDQITPSMVVLSFHLKATRIDQLPEEPTVPMSDTSAADSKDMSN